VDVRFDDIDTLGDLTVTVLDGAIRVPLGKIIGK